MKRLILQKSLGFKSTPQQAAGNALAAAGQSYPVPKLLFQRRKAARMKSMGLPGRNIGNMQPDGKRNSG